MGRYFIALVPSSPLHEEIQLIKKHFSDNYNSHGALRSPAHITLHMPFDLEGKKEMRLLNDFSDCAKGFLPFEIELDGFSCFEPKVIYISVKQCETMFALQKSIVAWMKSNFHIYNESDSLRPFHPHITVAFRDLKKSAFLASFQIFKNKKFEFQFQCATIELLQLIDGKWRVLQSVPFTQSL